MAANNVTPPDMAAAINRAQEQMAAQAQAQRPETAAEALTRRQAEDRARAADKANFARGQISRGQLTGTDAAIWLRGGK